MNFAQRQVEVASLVEEHAACVGQGKHAGA